MIALDDYASLALFARVVHHRSFSAAAREAGIAKSAVSRRVAKLERAFGVRLLHRTTRAFAITDEGLRLYERCAALVAEATAAEDAVSQAGEVRGVLRVSAPITFAQMYLAPAIAGFLRTHPQVEVALVLDDRIVDVVDGGFDVAVRIGRLEDSSLVARKLASDRLVVCGAPAYLAERGEPETPADLAEHECLHYGLVPRAAEWRFRRAPPVPTRGRFTTTNGAVLRELALEGAGLVVLPLFMVAGEVATGRLRLVLEGSRRARIGIRAVTATRAHLPARTRAFVDALVDHFADPDWMTAARRPAQ